MSDLRLGISFALNGKALETVLDASPIERADRQLVATKPDNGIAGLNEIVGLLDRDRLDQIDKELSERKQHSNI